MKSSLYIRTICIALVMLVMTAFFTLGASATLGFRDGLGRNSDDPTQGTAGEDGVVPDTVPSDSAPGTGEFGDDTSDTSDAATDDTSDTMNDSMNDSSTNNGSNPVDSAIDNVVTDATGAIDDAANDMTNGMGVWGIVIVIAIIAAIAILVFAFFSKRK